MNFFVVTDSECIKSRLKIGIEEEMKCFKFILYTGHAHFECNSFMGKVVCIVEWNGIYSTYYSYVTLVRLM